MDGGELSVPYLSFITSSRNDDHGENMFVRMQATVSSAITQMERNKLKSEVILVDYNPPPDRPLLKDALAFPRKTSHCSIRSIIVPNSVHRQYPDSGKLNFNGSVAQNVGIRRARGRFIVCTPVDILFSNELVRFVVEQGLREDRLYRADRLDVAKEAVEIQDLDERLRFCSENVIRIYSRDGTIPVLRRKKHHFRSQNLNLDMGNKKIPRLHFNASDLLLMSKTAWHSMHGFPEMDCISLASDSLINFMAYFIGVREEILPEPCRIYHVDHDYPWRDKVTEHVLSKILFYCFHDKIALRMRRSLVLAKRCFMKHILRKDSARKCPLKECGISNVNMSKLWQIVFEMKEGKRPVAYNDAAWGLRDENLEQYFVVKAAWES
jgi:glycosyltransferase involved in cell wall biosynthesis